MKKAISAISGIKSKVIGKKQAPKVKELISGRQCLLHRHDPTDKTVVDPNGNRRPRHASSTDERSHRLSLLDDAWVRAREITYLKGIAVICIRCLFCDMYHVLTDDEWDSGVRRGEYLKLEDVYTAMYGARAEPRFEPRIKDVIKLHAFLFPYIASQHRAGAVLLHSLDVLSRSSGGPDFPSLAQLRFTPSDQPYLDSSPNQNSGSSSAPTDEVFRSAGDTPIEQHLPHRPVLRIVTDIMLNSSDETETMSLRTRYPVRSPSIYFDAVEEQDHYVQPKFPDPSRVYNRSASGQGAADGITPGPASSNIPENTQSTPSPTRPFEDQYAPERFDFSRWVHDSSSPEPAPSITSDNGERTQESDYQATPQVQGSAGNTCSPQASSLDPNVEFQRFLQPTTGQLISRYSIRENSDLAFMRDRAWGMRSGYEGTLWG